MIRVLVILMLGAVFIPLKASAGTYSLCIGEYQHRCPQGWAYAWCGADPKEVARNFCRQEGNNGEPIVVKTAGFAGNKCGYGYYQITCQ